MLRVDDEEFRTWALSRRGALRRSAYLLTLDWHAADDLVQETLTRVYLAWRRQGRMQSVDAYARRVLVTSLIDTKRRPWRREVPEAEPADGFAAPIPEAHERHDDLVAALRAIPVAQRTVLVLRFWEDLSVEQTAALLGRRVGTVKSQTSRGLVALRDLLDPAAPQREEPVP